MEKSGKGPPVVCIHCKKTYKNLNTLSAHIGMDCGKSPVHKCKYCPYRCKRKFNLKTHVTTKHGHLDVVYGSKYQCTQCNKKYTRKTNLMRHVKWECNQEGSFICVVCCRRFKRKAHLQSHILNVHQDRL